MKQSDPLELVDAGILLRPGPIGRMLRVVLGILCLYALVVTIIYASSTTIHPIQSLPNRAPIFLGPLCVFNYVINIGYSKSWGQKPLIVSSVVLGLFAIVSYAATGSFDSPILGLPLNLWLGYFYAHLGLSFVSAGVLATPGCEMRSLPKLLSRHSVTPVKEHHCPVSFITKIDDWEHRRL